MISTCERHMQTFEVIDESPTATALVCRDGSMLIRVSVAVKCRCDHCGGLELDTRKLEVGLPPIEMTFLQWLDQKLRLRKRARTK